MTVTSTAKRQPIYGTFTGQNSLTERIFQTLVIDDSEFDRKRVARICNETGLNYAVSAIDGVDTLRNMLDSQKFDLAIVDYRLAKADGIQAVRRIRSHPAQMNAAILMLTGQGDLTTAVDAMKAGCSDYLDKATLSAAALRRATLNAVEKSLLHQDLMRARGLNDKLADLVRHFATDSVSEMKPLVLELMRESRSQMSGPIKGRSPSAKSMDVACRKLWALLEAMESNAQKL